MTRAVVTVVMPAHNVESFVAAAIRSILGQTFEDFELWVLENGSTDRTADVAAGFSDPRVKVFRLGPVGFQGALSYALEHATSEWLARMDSDDICPPSRLAKQLEIVRDSPQFVAVGTGFAMLTPGGHVVESTRSVSSRVLDKTSVALGGYRAAHPRGRISADASMMFRRQVALDVGGYDPAFTMGDVPLWLRMLEHNTGWEIAESLYVYRMRPSSFKSTHLEGVNAREKYAPELLDDYLRAHYGTTVKPTGGERTVTGYWRRVGYLELVAGDAGAAVRAATRLAKAGNARSASVLGMRALASKLGVRTAQQFRHRPDLEREVAAYG